MNYLAHLYLAEDSEESLVGNFLGDFVKGKLVNQYSSEILKGIKTHRKIDAYTDSHERVKRCKRLISPERKRYSGIIVDILFDHFLSKNWNSYSDIELDQFISNIYKVFERNQEIVPENVQKIIPRLIRNDWLSRYLYIDGLATVFEGMSKRVKRENPLLGAEEELLQNYEEFEENFKLFFPQVIEYVDNIRKYL